MLSAFSSPLFLYHYFEATHGPFRNLSDLESEAAEAILQQLRDEGNCFAARRAPDYLRIRRELEERIRALFVQKRGQPRRERPHYMIVGACDWLCTWYQEVDVVTIPLSAFHPQTISFTYGDSFPAMLYTDGKPYRDQVYTLDELQSLIQQYGLPQDWNQDGACGPERYIEAQIWDDQPLQAYMYS
ncbi:hypothetical protein KSF_051870 [Reticulibacter mediterranei]|uniref:Uncharacterized protein n=1 Tax=Reticulibacter mediterranei TaxID=2778369 RepID=A0A8J3N1H4_9CHLR|nr:hypothetical protein [Reticulibacter mediterranei]GHO95139.1 hypothetical protein KSF_051870 [Reticulibacter mediterranei]